MPFPVIFQVSGELRAFLGGTNPAPATALLSSRIANEVVRVSYPYVYRVAIRLMQTSRVSDMPLAVLPATAEELGQVVTVMASTPLRVAMGVACGVTLAFRHGIGMAAFSPDDVEGYQQFLMRERDEKVASTAPRSSASGSLMNSILMAAKSGQNSVFTPATTFGELAQQSLVAAVADDRDRHTLRTRCKLECAWLAGIGLFAFAPDRVPSFPAFCRAQLLGEDLQPA
jgi:hypothetical protein